MIGKTLHIIRAAAMCQGVIVTKSEKKAEQLKKLADEYCRRVGMKPPMIRTYKHRPTPHDGLRPHFTIIDENRIFEEE